MNSQLTLHTNLKFSITKAFIDIPWGFPTKYKYSGKIFIALVSLMQTPQNYNFEQFKFNYDELAEFVGIASQGKKRYEIINKTLEALKEPQIPFYKNTKIPWITEYTLNNITHTGTVRLPIEISAIFANNQQDNI